MWVYNVTRIPGIGIEAAHLSASRTEACPLKPSFGGPDNGEDLLLLAPYDSYTTTLLTISRPREHSLQALPP